MRNSSARCRHQPEQTATCQSQSSQKKKRRVPRCPGCTDCPTMRQEPFDILALVLPCGQGNFPGIGRPERVLNELFPNGRLLRIFRLRVAEEQHVAQVHLLPGTLLPQRKLWNSSGSPAARNTNPTVDCFRSKRLRQFVLESREQAVLHETLSPDSHWLSSLLFVSHICLFTLSEDPGCAGTYD